MPRAISVLTALMGTGNIPAVPRPPFTLEDLLALPDVESGPPPPDRLAMYRWYLLWQVFRPEGVALPGRREPYADTLPDVALKILDFLHQHPGVNATHMARELGIGQGWCHTMARRLESDGLALSAKQGRATVYSLTEAGRRFWTERHSAAD